MAKTCPECATPVGPGTGTDVYKHVIQCFHLPNEGADQLLAKYQNQDDERSKRIVRILKSDTKKE